MDLHPDSCDFSNARQREAVAAEMRRLLCEPYSQMASIRCEGYTITRDSVLDDLACARKEGLAAAMSWDIPVLGLIF